MRALGWWWHVFSEVLRGPLHTDRYRRACFAGVFCWGCASDGLSGCNGAGSRVEHLRDFRNALRYRRGRIAPLTVSYIVLVPVPRHLNLCKDLLPRRHCRWCS